MNSNINSDLDMNDPKVQEIMMKCMTMLMNNQNNMNSMNLPNAYDMKKGIFTYYNIKHKDVFNDKTLSKKEKNLLLFFNGITNFKKEYHKNGSKIIINYYNLEKIELYLDLDLEIENLISIIFGYIFYDYNSLIDFIVYKRTQTEQTTEHIVNFPKRYKKDNGTLSKRIIFLEYKNKNLNCLHKKTGYEIGLKDGEEILLKLNENYYNQLISLPFDRMIHFNLHGDPFSFPTFIGESSEECKKRLSSLFDNRIEYKGMDCPNIFSESTIKDNNLLNVRNYIHIPNRLCGGGGPPIIFSDISKEKTKELKFSESAPPWRKVKEGLNIFGICENDECKAHKKEVVYIPKDNNKEHKFNLNDNIDQIICPICQTIIKVKTCGFWKCEYQFIGKKIEKGRLIDYNSMPKETKNDKFEYFDPSDNGNILWKELIIYVIPKQKIKYKP